MLGEHLNAIACAIANIDQPVIGNVHAMHRRLEIRRVQIVGIVRGLRIVGDFRNRLAIGAPAALELARFQVEHVTRRLRYPSAI